ncbi:MAG TPA: CorA family divalent cation transporter [Anaerolineales bacterium]|nr:CorA family divalent cation transporter [Anaerolineales bacterium]
MSDAAAATASATIVHTEGLHRDPSLADLRGHITEGRYVWLDICGPPALADEAMLLEIGMDAAATAWIRRFDQAGRLAISRHGIRAVSWLAAPGVGLIEIHVWASGKGVVTLWHGKPELLGNVRQEFVERVGGASRSYHHLAAILLQLLLGSLEQAIIFIDERLQALHDRIQNEPTSIDFARLSHSLELLRGSWLKFDRYASAVRSATVGIEAIADITPDAVRELNEYAEYVEDTENRLHERIMWGSHVVQDFATSLAQRRGEMISRLTIVSIFFLPITFFTGFFGMNFNWMAEQIGSRSAFLTFGILLPLVCAGVTVLWLKRKALL